MHLQDPPAFVASHCGRVLGVKVGLAGLSRFRLLPAVNRGGGLPTTLRTDTAVLFTVSAATGALSTSALPYTGEMTGVLANLQGLPAGALNVNPTSI